MSAKKLFEQLLEERLSYDELFRMSDPKRVVRSFTVKGPPLEMDMYQDSVYHSFNFKSSPSTTGLRHRGYIKFIKPKGPERRLHKLECVVDCECPDFRYRWAWTNKQRGSSVVGPKSLNQAHNKAPRITNPTGAPGLCKHILAARDYIFNLLAEFPDDGGEDVSYKLNKLTKHAQKRWTNFDDQVAAARAKEAMFAKQKALKNVYGPGADKAEVAPEKKPATKPLPATTAPAKPVKPEEPAIPTTAAKVPNIRSKAEKDFYRRQGLGDSIAYTLKNENNAVFIGENMNNLKEAIRLVEELEKSELEAQDSKDSVQPPSIYTDDAETVGGTPEGDDETALSLLAQMKDLLTQIATSTEAVAATEVKEEEPLPEEPKPELPEEPEAGELEGEEDEEEDDFGLEPAPEDEPVTA